MILKNSETVVTLYFIPVFGGKLPKTGIFAVFFYSVRSEVCAVVPRVIFPSSSSPIPMQLYDWKANGKAVAGRVEPGGGRGEAADGQTWRASW